MKTLKSIIQEKLTISKNSEINQTRYLSNKDLNKDFFDNFTSREGDLDKFDREISQRLYSPQKFINKVKYKEQLFIYWFKAVITDWEEAYDLFRDEIINRKYATDDEIDATVIEIMELFSHSKNVENYCQKYLDRYNIKIKDN